MSKATGTTAHRNLDAYNAVWRARRGDPGALREILQELAAHLKGEAGLSVEYAEYCSECLESFVQSEVMLQAEPGYRKLIAVLASEEYFKDADTPGQVNLAELRFRNDTSLGASPKIPNEAKRDSSDAWSQKLSLARIGRAFTKAFNLSSPQGKQEQCPEYIRRVEDLLYLGESQTHAIKIVRSAVESPLSATQIRKWLEKEGIRTNELDPEEIQRCSTKLGLFVQAQIDQGVEFEAACTEISRRYVQKVVGLSEATIFLKPSTVRKAYNLSRREVTAS